ncbi:hemocyte protein-glutamine gamma-glutamyltransferase-like [Ixodes scapularis]
MDNSEDAIVEMLKERMVGNSTFLQYMEIVIERLRSGEEFERTPMLMAHTGGAKTLQVTQLDYHIPANTRHHHTDKFLLTQSSDATLVVRRGLPVTYSVQFDRPYDGIRDQVFIILNTGLDPSEENGGRVKLEVPTTRGSFFATDNSPWSICLVLTEKSSITVKVMLPPIAPVGLWRLEVETRLRDSDDPGDRALFNVKETFYILFNPWNPEDLVYLPDETLIKEYIFEDTGKLYQGNYDYPTGKRWYFGQFTDVVLPTCNYLFELGDVSVQDRACPVKLSRHIAALVDSRDENGVLVGSWSNDYGDGVSPTTWTSSTTILEQYMNTGGAPVKYGQCWVYSGLVTTLCRALGIPCRSITNFSSAHDTDGNLLIERFFDENDNPIFGKTEDSIWNFHLWNELWMQRPDLPGGYGGWQVIDATPQTISDGLFRVGPCPVAAVYNGHLEVNYDARFVYAEVNADLISWKRDAATKQFKQSNVKNENEADAAGMLIYTKKIGEMTEDNVEDAEDLTGVYKGVKVAPKKSVMGLSGAVPPDEVEMKMVEVSSVPAGQSVKLAVTCTNNSKAVKKVSLTLSASSVFYTGGEYKQLKKGVINLELQPGKTETGSITVTPEDYQTKLAPYNIVKLFALGRVQGSGQGSWFKHCRIAIGNPSMEVKVSGPLNVSRAMEYSLSFDNPLNTPLTGCSLTLDISGITLQSQVHNVPDVPAKGKFVYTGKIIPKRPGEKSVMGVFNSKELKDIRGTKVVHVK